MGLFDITVETMLGEEKTLEEYKGNVLLIVNTASKCGYSTQLQDLQELHEEFKDTGLTVIGVPSGQFLRQEFETNTEILDFCRSNYGVSFLMLSKAKIKGRKKIDLYKYLINNSPERKGKEIRWNFEKFLINRSGKIVKRYKGKVKPRLFKKDIEKIL